MSVFRSFSFSLSFVEDLRSCPGNSVYKSFLALAGKCLRKHVLGFTHVYKRSNITQSRFKVAFTYAQIGGDKETIPQRHQGSQESLKGEVLIWNCKAIRG